MIIVTGGAGFIGSNIVKSLNAQGYTDILVVDDLEDGTKFVNLSDLDIADYLDKDDFMTLIKNDKVFENLEAVFHEGACSSTTEWDGKFMMQNNYQYSVELLHYCLEQKVPYLYASSASVWYLQFTAGSWKDLPYPSGSEIQGDPPRPPASSTRTLWRCDALNCSASTQPAEPAPIII